MKVLTIFAVVLGSALANYFIGREFDLNEILAGSFFGLSFCYLCGIGVSK